MKPKDIQLIQFLSQLDKPLLNIADLEKILGLKNRASLHVTLHRLTGYGVLERLRRGVYRLSLRPHDAAHMANLLYTPSYLSFESALSRHGILSQIPYTMTFATPRRSKKMRLGEVMIEFRQLRADLFFGYVLEQGLYLAEPEKALLDELYLIKRGRASIALDELRYDGLSMDKIEKYASRFPSYVQNAVREIVNPQKA
jgi:predicted transcriptional regulator of viral defense system